MIGFLYGLLKGFGNIKEADQDRINFGLDQDPICLTHLQLISNLLVKQSLSMKNCSVEGCHHYGALWKFFAVKLVAFYLLLWFADIHFGPSSGPT